MRFACLILALAPAIGGAANLNVVSAVGGVSVLTAGQQRTVRAGEVLTGPVQITTAANAAVQLRNLDGVQMALGAGSELRIDEAEKSLALVSGQVAVWTNDKPWSIDAAGTLLRMRGYLRLKVCAQGCTQPQGVYGRGHGGDVVAEYKGGRSLLRDRLFLLPTAGGKPELLARDQGFLGSLPNFDSAVAAKQATAEEVQQGLAAFKAGRYDEANQALTRVRNNAPAEVIVSYYLGLIALEQQRNADALRELQRYAKEDALGARERGVSQLLTLLTSAALQQEVSAAIAQESSVSASPPEPGSIAVQAFASRASGENAALAKGIAAMVISDLSKVPGLKVLERQKVQKIADEIRLSSSGLVDANTAVRSGRLMRAERVVIGTMEFE
jgi:tetratricopeptide (TPR) repeat protein